MKEILIYKALDMLRERQDYWHNRNPQYASAFDSAVEILEAAISGDTETLNNLDYLYY